MQLSARNQIPARVTSINSGEAIANVELSANGVRLVASITVADSSTLAIASPELMLVTRAGIWLRALSCMTDSTMSDRDD